MMKPENDIAKSIFIGQPVWLAICVLRMGCPDYTDVRVLILYLNAIRFICGHFVQKIRRGSPPPKDSSPYNSRGNPNL